MARLTPSKHASFIDQLEAVFKAMTDAYQASAKTHGFVCRGCEDNCCKSLFYNYTLLEYVHLIDGLKRLDDLVRTQVLERAHAAARQNDKQKNALCPLNVDSICILYEQRLMICRLHGIPHQLQSPAQTIVSGPGCDDFVRQCGPSTANPLDRTPFYRQLSALEKKLRQAVGANLKLKMTIAQMIAQTDKENL